MDRDLERMAVTSTGLRVEKSGTGSQSKFSEKVLILNILLCCPMCSVLSSWKLRHWKLREKNIVLLMVVSPQTNAIIYTLGPTLPVLVSKILLKDVQSKLRRPNPKGMKLSLESQLILWDLKKCGIGCLDESRKVDFNSVERHKHL